MSNENKKQRRNFSMIFRFMQLFMLMVIIFFLSFFVTIVVKTPHPIDHIKNVYFDDRSADKIIDDYAKLKNEERNIDTSTIDDKHDTKKFDTSTIDDKSDVKKFDTSTIDNKSDVKKFDTSTISGRIDRVKHIKQAVNEKIRDKEHYVKLDEIPLTLRQAIIAVEDSRFYTHDGYDIGGILRATVTNVEAGQIEEGGSTITQQLVKNLFLTQEQSFARKIEELFLAMSMEDEYSKDQILELYLNTIYFGSNFYGIYDASIGYFGVEPKELTLAESTMIAGLPNAPSLYSPYVDFMLAKKRQLVVIDAMLRDKKITNREAEKAKIDSIVLARDK